MSLAVLLLVLGDDEFRRGSRGPRCRHGGEKSRFFSDCFLSNLVSNPEMMIVSLLPGEASKRTRFSGDKVMMFPGISTGFHRSAMTTLSLLTLSFRFQDGYGTTHK